MGAGTKRRAFGRTQALFHAIGGRQRSDGQDTVGGLVLRCGASVCFPHRWAATCTCMSHVYIHARGGKMAAVDKTMQHVVLCKGCTTCMQHAFFFQILMHDRSCICILILPALLHTLTSHTHTSRWWQAAASPWSQGSLRRRALFSSVWAQCRLWPWSFSGQGTS